MNKIIPAQKPGPVETLEQNQEKKEGQGKLDQAFITEKDSKALIHSKYEQKHKKFPKAFLLQNKKSKAMVELRGFTPVHAAKMIGWRPRHVKLLAERMATEKELAINE